MYDSGRGGLPRDEQRARQLFESAAQFDVPDAIFHLGLMHEYGKAGFNADLSAAIVLYQRAARLGSQYAADRLRDLGQKQ